MKKNTTNLQSFPTTTENNTQVYDSENVEIPDIDIINAQKINNNNNSIQKKAKKKTKSIPFSNKFPSFKPLSDSENDFLEFVLGDFHDFHKIHDLEYFKKMEKLTLINEFITDVSLLINNLPDQSKIVYLCLNQNEIKNIRGIEHLINLNELQLNFNYIEKIPKEMKKLKNLKKFWICDNLIKTIENLPENLENFWIAKNQIETIEKENFNENNLNKLIFLNIAGNFISDLKDIFNIENMNIKYLYLNDVNFGENPICLYNNYRNLIIHILKDLLILDQIIITESEKIEVENFYTKKNLFYKNKIRQNHKITKNIINYLKSFKLFFNNFKLYQIYFFSLRYKMLDIAKIEKKKLDNIENEKISSTKKKNFLIKLLSIQNLNFKNLKNFLHNLNDLNIVNNFYEIETNANFKIEPGNNNNKWTKSCIDLMKMKSKKNFKIKSIFKITNKKSKLIFDSLYDNYIDKFKKFGDEKKYFDFYFLILPKKHLCYRKIYEFIFENKNDKKLILTDNFTLLDNILQREKNEKNEKNNENNNNNNYFCIICKCMNFENIIQNIETNFNANNVDKNNYYNNMKNFFKENDYTNKDILKTKVNYFKIDNEIETNLFYFNFPDIVEPEYLVEYIYENDNKNSNLNINDSNILNINENNEINDDNNNEEDEENYFVSSFEEKIECNNNIFNNCSKKLFDKKTFFNQEKINKYVLCNFDEFNELENNILFFAKNSILNFCLNCFKYNSISDFENDLNNIDNKIEEIKKIKYNSNNEIKIIDNYCYLFNGEINDNNLEKYFNNIEINENVNNIIFVKNNLNVINFDLILKKFPNVKNIDFSFNNINNFIFTLKDKKFVFDNFDVSFNNIKNHEVILRIINNFYIKNFVFYGNPIKNKFFDKNFIFDSISSEKLQNLFNTENKTNNNNSNNNNNNNNLINNNNNSENKNFDYLYDCFSFSEVFHNFSNNIYFYDKIHKEKNLKTVILSKKKLTNIPSINKPDTEILYLNLNKITILSNLSQFLNLIELYISNNKIPKFQNLPISLRKIDISNNSLTSLKGIENCVNLEILNVENNLIESVKEILSLNSLKEFYIAGNLLKNLKELTNLGKLKKLIILDISNNEVCKIHDMRITMIFYCLYLKNFNRINIDNNERNKAKEYFNGKLTNEVLEKKLGNKFNTKNLTDLDLSNLKLKDEINLFNNDNYPRLIKLNLSRNNFKTFSIFGNLPNLLELNLNFNLFLEIIPKNTKINKNNKDNIFGITNLESLEMSGNQLSNLNGIVFLANLKILVLRENNLNKIEQINKMNNLTFLDVSFNKLRSIDRSQIGILPNLQIFLCDNNYLKNINGFTKFLNINTLSFENNKIIDYAGIEKLNSLENLKDFSIFNNPVTKNLNYRNYMIKMFPNLSKLDGKEITNEEKEYILMEMQLGEGYDSNNNNNNNNFNGNYNSNNNDYYEENYIYNNNNYANNKINFNMRMQDKGIKKINYIQIGLSAQPYLAKNFINNLNNNVVINSNKTPNKKNFLPQIRNTNINMNINNNFVGPFYNYNNNNINVKPMSESRKRLNSNNNANHSMKSNRMSNKNVNSHNNYNNNNNNKKNIIKDYYSYVTKSLTNDINYNNIGKNYNNKRKTYK